LALVQPALLGVEAAPGGVERDERVLDEVARAHSRIIAVASRPAPGHRRGRWVKCWVVRIALLSPYSWTYPGGVTRHIDALARELRASGHEAHVLAPWDPDDALSARLHRGARPQQIAQPEGFTGLGRTVGIPANGAVSNVSLTPYAVLSARRALAQGGYDGVHLPEIAATPVDPQEGRGHEHPRPPDPQSGVRILFIGLAVERKGLPVLLRAFEALREHAPATLTLVGPRPEDVAHMMLDDHDVRALGMVSDQRKLEELARADVLCAPSLGGESFGMVLTEAFASATPVLASDIPGYRDVVRDGVDGELVPAADALALAESLRRLP